MKILVAEDDPVARKILAITIQANNVSAAAGALETIGHSGLLEGAQRALDELNVAMAILRPRLVALVGAA